MSLLERILAADRARARYAAEVARSLEAIAVLARVDGYSAQTRALAELPLWRRAVRYERRVNAALRVIARLRSRLLAKW